ncbi:MAG: cysteine desulfurase family protein [Planctomycetota bacterium]
MIYLDHHATTPCDQRVVDAMLPWFGEHFGNPHSDAHAMGRYAADAIEKATDQVAESLSVPRPSIVFTSGATESNNLAIRGVCLHPRQKRRHVITIATEHPAVLDVVDDLVRDGFRVTKLSVGDRHSTNVGQVDLDRLADALDDDTALVSVMWANNEIGTIAPMQQIASLVHDRGALLHSDATQAVGRLPIDIASADVDLISASAHKFYGPKGSGLLVVGNGNRRVRLRPQIVGGGQQHQLRSGTVNPAGVIGLTKALELRLTEMASDRLAVRAIRDRLWCGLNERMRDLVSHPLELNGPELEGPRLEGNLNLVLPGVEGEAWMSATPGCAFSSGSACSSAEPTPSHVLMAIGLSESEARRSVRFGIGRTNTVEEIDRAVEALTAGYQSLVKLA